MEIPELVRDDLVTAMEAFDLDDRGRGRWANWPHLENYKYAISFRGQLYPAKFIIERSTGIPVSEFKGGKGGGGANLAIRKTGLKVVPIKVKKPAWNRDELILTMNLYMANRYSLPQKGSASILEFSVLLNRLGDQIHDEQYDDYRNINGVYMKLMNFRSLDPIFESKGLENGGKLEKEIWDEFVETPEKLEKYALSIIKAIEQVEMELVSEAIDIYEEEAEEGKIVSRLHHVRERSRKLISKKKEQVLKELGLLKCEACGFEFSSIYGERGDGFIECHHKKPIHKMEVGEKTKLSDLALLCSNCHRMIHAKTPWLTVDDLKTLPMVKALKELYSDLT